MRPALDPITSPLGYRCRRESGRRMLTAAACSEEGREARREALENLCDLLGDPYNPDLDLCDDCEGPIPISSINDSLLPNPAPESKPDFTPPEVRSRAREHLQETPCR